jgi:hypothetical protein
VVPSAIPSRLTVSECIALARKHEEEAREVPILDLDFAAMSKKLFAIANPGIRRRGTNFRFPVS